MLQGGVWHERGQIRMTYRHTRRYCGRLQAAILDWAGTTVDFGCQAPVAAFIAAFAEAGIEASVAEARAPMGQAKWQHLWAMAQMPRIAAAWLAKHGRPAGKADIDALYERFAPLQTEIVLRHSGLIPGTLEAVTAMRARGMKLGSTSGYPRVVMDAVVARARAQRFTLDCVISADDTRLGRPSPFPALRALAELEVYPVEAAVKIGDTVVDIEEGLNGGMWSVGVALSGNEVGLGLAEWQALLAPQQTVLRRAATARLAAAGAHYVIDTIAGIGPVLDEIDQRLAQGGKP
jgi:phosphonoacetaldehyde hydrolase